MHCQIRCYIVRHGSYQLAVIIVQLFRLNNSPLISPCAGWSLQLVLGKWACHIHATSMVCTANNLTSWCSQKHGWTPLQQADLKCVWMEHWTFNTWPSNSYASVSAAKHYSSRVTQGISSSLKPNKLTNNIQSWWWVKLCKSFIPISCTSWVDAKTAAAAKWFQPVQDISIMAANTPCSKPCIIMAWFITTILVSTLPTPV